MPLCTWMCKYPRPFLLFFWIYIPRNEIAGSCGSSPEKAMTTYSSILAWRIPWTEEPVYGYSPWRCRESDTTKQLLLSLFMEILLLNHMTKIEFHMNCMNHILGFFFEVSSNFLKAKIQQNVRYTVWFLLWGSYLLKTKVSSPGLAWQTKHTVLTFPGGPSVPKTFILSPLHKNAFIYGNTIIPKCYILT